MADITVTITGAVGGPLENGVTKTIQISDDDSDRLLAYVQTKHGQTSEGVVLTTEQAIETVVRQFANNLFAQVLKWERQIAAQQASEGVKNVPFDLT